MLTRFLRMKILQNKVCIFVYILYEIVWRLEFLEFDKTREHVLVNLMQCELVNRFGGHYLCALFVYLLFMKYYVRNIAETY